MPCWSVGGSQSTCPTGEISAPSPNEKLMAQHCSVDDDTSMTNCTSWPANGAVGVICTRSVIPSRLEDQLLPGANLCAVGAGGGGVPVVVDAAGGLAAGLLVAVVGGAGRVVATGRGTVE